jgi:hypothetical protein
MAVPLEKFAVDTTAATKVTQKAARWDLMMAETKVVE